MDYPYFKFGTWNNCAYCGDAATCMDHAMPMAYIAQGDRRWGAREKIGPQTPACSKCNGKLASRMFYSFEARCEFVSDFWGRKAAKASARWDHDEILELKGGLRNFVILRQIDRTEFFRRWKWFGSEEYYMNLENLLYEPTLCHSEPQFNSDYREYFSATLSEITSCLDARSARKRDSEATF